MDGLKKAIEAAGGGAELARRLNVRRQAIYQWREVPPLRVLEIERVTGISRHVLRPDLYGPPPAPIVQETAA
ncbi:Cro/CI family transcriptional regulator [Xanthobacter sp.]|uniref:transcriptional regulator n=1 Tax=Xanthobacter sp. TaxID=35809 RepID=UPI0025FF368A|nr:Cro/CI family transcriptional regulator [Xanthobacter sp.]